MAIGTTIDGLGAVTSLTAQDEVPVWDKEASGEPTKKITAQNMTASVKTLGSLVNTTEMNNALAGKQNTLTFDSTPTAGSTNPVTSGGIADAIAQSTAITTVSLGATGYTAQVTYHVRQAIKQSGRVTIQLTCVFNIDLPSSKVVATVPDGYRPNAEVLVPALITTNSDAMLFEYVIVKPNGEIIQQSTNSCRKVFVCADYAL